MLEPTTLSEKCSNEKRKEDDDDKMLRSEVKWFPHFLDQCKQSLSYRDPQCMDHDAMKRVAACTCYRQVWSILNDYRETAFKYEIWEYEHGAKTKAKQMERAKKQS